MSRFAAVVIAVIVIAVIDLVVVAISIKVIATPSEEFRIGFDVNA
jgi:hypothetical protein